MPNTNTSATGGPLAPAITPAPLEGQALLRFIQQWVVGITGLDGTVVRPYWQGQAPVLPDVGTIWAAVGVGTRKADTFPVVRHDGSASAGQGADKMQRHERLMLRISFYDTGVEGQADTYAAIMRDGAVIAQNREVLLSNGFDLGFTGDLTPAPVVIKTRWMYRVDLEIQLRRQIDRTYPVLNLLSAEFTLVTDDTGVNENWDQVGLNWDTPNQNWDSSVFETTVEVTNT